MKDREVDPRLVVRRSRIPGYTLGCPRTWVSDRLDRQEEPHEAMDAWENLFRWLPRAGDTAIRKTDLDVPVVLVLVHREVEKAPSPATGNNEFRT